MGATELRVVGLPGTGGTPEAAAADVASLIPVCGTEELGPDIGTELLVVVSAPEVLAPVSQGLGRVVDIPKSGES